MTGQGSFWFGAAEPFYDYEIQNSMLFNGSGGLRFSSGEANTSYWTLSVWIKRHELDGNYATIMSATNYGSTYYTDVIGFGSANTMLSIRGSNANSFTASYGTAKIRDTTNWYHYCLRNSGGTVTRWLNGVQDSTYSVSGTFIGIGRSGNHDLGAYGGSSASYNNQFSLADFYFINDSSFGADDVYDWTQFAEFKNGVLVPKENSLTAAQIGDGGIFLQFQQIGDNADANGVGADTSGNGHHASIIGTVSSHCRATIDTPTNNFMTFNYLHYADSTSSKSILSQGSLYAHCDSDDGIFTTIEIPTSGKWYVEFVLAHVSKPSGVYILGNKHKTRDDWTHVANYTSFREGFAIQGSTNKVFEYGGTEIGSTHSSGTIYAFLIDVDNSTYDIYQNDTKIWDAGTFNHPGAGEGVIIGVGNNSDSGTNNCNFYLNAGQDSSFSGQKTSGSSNSQDANGIGDFYYTTKGGLALCSANLPNPKISPNSVTQADDHFDTDAYTGSASNQTRTLNFQADWMWFKERTTDGIQHQLFDSSRLHSTSNAKFGRKLDIAGSTLSSEADSTAIVSQSGNDVTLSGGVSTVNDQYSRTYVNWHWKANGGITSNNTQGSKTSTVQANTTAGFSIVLYSGDTSSFTVGHGLNSAPEWIIVKSRTHSERWTVFHTSVPNEYNYLNDSLASQTGNADERFGNSTSVVAPSETVVTLGANNSDVSKDGENYVMYCFHSVEGYSKFSSYSGNGSTDGTFVYTGFRPAWLLIRRTAAHNWYLFDNKRNTSNVVNLELNPNTTQGDDTFTTLDFTSNGFKLRTSNDAFNVNTYIYMAFAEQPFKFSNAR